MNQEQMTFVLSDDLNMDGLHQIDYNNEAVCHNMEHYSLHYGFFAHLLIFLSVVNISVFISLFIVSVFVYRPMVEKALKEPIDFDFPEEPYEYKYNLKNVFHENDDVNPNSYVCETTPDGVVFMKYDNDEEGFVFWSNKQIQFKYLDTVARKYVKSFLCKKLYIPNNVYDEEIDVDYESETDDSDIEQDTNTDKSEVQNSNDESNDESSNDESTNDIDNKEDSDNDVFIKKSKPQDTRSSKYERVREEIKRNKFVRKGRISDLELMKKYEPEEVVTKKKMTFDTFKELFYGKTETIE